ncbi:MAG TPA: hypothetical protein VMV77_09225 [Bacteroidales bacterium]|nr:hypothetical protein [Bacteroidales bacterium]
MRLFEINILIYDKDDAEIKGGEKNADDYPSKAIIDLNAVTSFWNNGDKDVVIYLKGGESYTAKNITYNQFRDACACIESPIGDNRVDEACPCCGMAILDHECNICGYRRDPK